MTDKQKLESLAAKLRFPAVLGNSKKLNKFNELINITPEHSSWVFIKFLERFLEESGDIFKYLAELPHEMDAAKRFIEYERMTHKPVVSPKLREFVGSFDKMVKIYDKSI